MAGTNRKLPSHSPPSLKRKDKKATPTNKHLSDYVSKVSNVSSLCVVAMETRSQASSGSSPPSPCLLVGCTALSKDEERGGASGRGQPCLLVYGVSSPNTSSQASVHSAPPPVVPIIPATAPPPLPPDVSINKISEQDLFELMIDEFEDNPVAMATPFEGNKLYLADLLGGEEGGGGGGGGGGESLSLVDVLLLDDYNTPTSSETTPTGEATPTSEATPTTEATPNTEATPTNKATPTIEATPAPTTEATPTTGATPTNEATPTTEVPIDDSSLLVTNIVPLPYDDLIAVTVVEAEPVVKGNHGSLLLYRLCESQCGCTSVKINHCVKRITFKSRDDVIISVSGFKSVPDGRSLLATVTAGGVLRVINVKEEEEEEGVVMIYTDSIVTNCVYCQGLHKLAITNDNGEVTYINIRNNKDLEHQPTLSKCNIQYILCV